MDFANDYDNTLYSNITSTRVHGRLMSSRVGMQTERQARNFIGTPSSFVRVPTT